MVRWRHLGWMERPLRILLVEDNDNDVKIIQRGLNRDPDKPEIHRVRNGEEALDVLHRRRSHEDAPRPDVILSCLNLPKCAGLDLLATLKEDPKLQRIPFIVLTNSDREEDRVRAYAAGASGYFTKPVDEEEFEETLQILCSYWNRARTSPE